MDANKRRKRIDEEAKRLERLFAYLPDEKFNIARTLIKRAAFMLITLEDLEDDINANGAIETFSQTKDVEYDRERPATKIYNTTIKNYQNACKQLFELLPNTPNESVADELLSFVQSARHK